MKRSYRLLTLLLVLPFLAGTNSFAGSPIADSATDRGVTNAPALSVLSPSGKTIDFYRLDSSWKAVSAEEMAGLSNEVNAIPESILDKINTVAPVEGAAGEGEWFCEIIKHTDGPWTWNCWRDS